MKYVMEYKDYSRLNESWKDLDKFEKGYSILGNVANGLNNITHGFYTNKQKQSVNTFDGPVYPFASKFNLKNLLKWGGLLAGGVAITIGLIYFIMYQHDKKLDKLTPMTKSMLARYKKYLEDEFSPKELDDLYRIISTDQQILIYVHEYFNTDKASPEAEEYISKKLTKRQIEGILNVQSKMNESYLYNDYEELNENNIDGLFDEFAKDFKNNLKHSVKDFLVQILFGVIFTMIPQSIKNMWLNMFDSEYNEKLHQFDILLHGQFNEKEMTKINRKLMSSQRFISYLQRLNRTFSTQERKDLEAVMLEHIISILNENEINKFKYILNMGEKLGLFNQGMFTAFSNFHTNSAGVARGAVLGAVGI